MPPLNFGAYIAEVAGGLEALYGAPAAEDYRRKAKAVVASNLQHPAVRAWGAMPKRRPDAGMLSPAPPALAAPVGLLFGVLREPLAEISFVHVLREHLGQGIERALVERAVGAYRAHGVDGIVCECVPMCRLELPEVFAGLGFERIRRRLMTAPLDAPDLRRQGTGVAGPYGPDDFAEIAACLVDAYREHPGRRLHNEVHNLLNALAFVSRVDSGSYGAVRPEYQQMIWRDATCVGGAVGVEIAPGVGFVLQIFVRPDYRGQGLGTDLLRALAQAFRSAGLDRMALGVTISNPALRLYERLGFETLRDTDAYVWWKSDNDGDVPC